MPYAVFLLLLAISNFTNTLFLAAQKTPNKTPSKTQRYHCIQITNDNRGPGFHFEALVLFKISNSTSCHLTKHETEIH